MKRFRIILLAVLCITLVSTAGISSINASAQSDVIPQWIKNNAKLWADSQISESEFIKGIQYLMDNNILRVSNQDEISKLKSENYDLQVQNIGLQTELRVDDKIKQIQDSKPTTVISNNTLNWYFSDSKGNKYHWTYSMSGYDTIVRQPIYIGTYNLQLQNGTTISTYDYNQFVNNVVSNHDFSKVIDQVYDNAGSDDQFIYEVWYIVAEMTTYSKDITHNNLWPLEVFTRGEGDCKDKSILIADMLRSSSHTENWKINLMIMDLDHPDNPQTVNHMIVTVDTGHSKYRVEGTVPTTVNGLNVWTGNLFGWSVPV